MLVHFGLWAHWCGSVAVRDVCLLNVVLFQNAGVSGRLYWTSMFDGPLPIGCEKKQYGEGCDVTDVIVVTCQFIYLFIFLYCKNSFLPLETVCVHLFLIIILRWCSILRLLWRNYAVRILDLFQLLQLYLNCGSFGCVLLSACLTVVGHGLPNVMRPGAVISSVIWSANMASVSFRAPRQPTTQHPPPSTLHRLHRLQTTAVQKLWASQ